MKVIRMYLRGNSRTVRGMAKESKAIRMGHGILESGRITREMVKDNSCHQRATNILGHSRMTRNMARALRCSLTEYR